MNPYISIVVPILNEEPYIERLTRSLLEQDYPHDRYEILMADGGCTDRTLEILRAVDSQGRVRVIPNPRRTAPAAMNELIPASKGEIITRVDGHSFVAPDYLSRIVAVMEETGESVVGGPAQMMADTPFRKALVEALNARIAVGAVPYRTLRTRAYVPSLQTGSFRRAVLEKVGRWDEDLAVVEDLDINTRIIESGHRLLLDPSIRFWYLPRPGLKALWRQIFKVGRVKARILKKHPGIFRLKYVLPSVFVISVAAALLAIASAGLGGSPAAAAAGAVLLATYALVVAAFALSRVPRVGAGAIRLLAILPVLHFGYGLGFLRGALEPAATGATQTSTS